MRLSAMPIATPCVPVLLEPMLTCSVFGLSTPTTHVPYVPLEREKHTNPRERPSDMLPQFFGSFPGPNCGSLPPVQASFAFGGVRRTACPTVPPSTLIISPFPPAPVDSPSTTAKRYDASGSATPFRFTTMSDSVKRANGSPAPSICRMSCDVELGYRSKNPVFVLANAVPDQLGLELAVNRVLVFFVSIPRLKVMV